MKHKKVITLTVVAVCLLLCFASCTNTDKAGDSHSITTTQNDFGSTQGNNQGNTPSEDQGSVDSQKITQNQIYECVSNYSDGLAFVRLAEASPILHCIDKTGKVIFTLEGYNVICGFHNGYALLYDTVNNSAVLCNTEGHVISSDEFGGGTFMNNTLDTKYTEMFVDGYLLLKKTETSFTGSTDYIAILTCKNGKWEKTTDFSEQLAIAYEKVGGMNGTSYYNGFYYFIGMGYLDLNAGEACENTADLYTKMTLKNKSDFWTKNGSGTGDYIYDERETWLTDSWFPEKTPIIDLSQYEETLYSVTDYRDGICTVIFRVLDSEVGPKYFLTLMDEEGKFLFEPIETTGQLEHYQHYKTNATVVVVSRNSNGEQVVEAFDTNGKVGEMVIEYEGWLLYGISLSDGVIAVTAYSNPYEDDYLTFYTTNMEPLF